MKEHDTEIFLPVRFGAYKENKVELLKTKMTVMKTADRINRIKDIRKIKTDQQRLLKKVIKEIRQEYQKIIKLLPTEREVRITQSVHTYRPMSTMKKPISTEERVKTKVHKMSKLDQELAKIQEKIKNLKL